jgi:hypothetical protein
MTLECPVYPQKRTLLDASGMSAFDPKRTLAKRTKVCANAELVRSVTHGEHCKDGNRCGTRMLVILTAAARHTHACSAIGDMFE